MSYWEAHIYIIYITNKNPKTTKCQVKNNLILQYYTHYNCIEKLVVPIALSCRKIAAQNSHSLPVQRVNTLLSTSFRHGLFSTQHKTKIISSFCRLTSTISYINIYGYNWSVQYFNLAGENFTHCRLFTLGKQTLRSLFKGRRFCELK